MNTTTFDTLTAARSLEGAGIEPKQAEAIVAAIHSSRSEIITKGDLSTAVAKWRCCMIQLRREWGRFSNFSFRTPQRRISAYPARPSG